MKTEEFHSRMDQMLEEEWETSQFRWGAFLWKIFLITVIIAGWYIFMTDVAGCGKKGGYDRGTDQHETSRVARYSATA